MHPSGRRQSQSLNGEGMAKDRGKENEALSLKKICRRAHEFAAPFRIGALARAAFRPFAKTRIPDELIASCGGPSNRLASIAGRFGIGELIDVLAAARCVVSVNTGVMHLGAAVGTWTIALNGPTSSARWASGG